MAARQSRAARGAQAAQADRKTSTVVPISGAGKSATGDNGGGQAKKPASKPEAKPDVMAGVQAYPKTFYRPTVNGTPVKCPHDPDNGKYGHDSEKAALACARKLAAA